jgi:hypothetical protein
MIGGLFILGGNSMDKKGDEALRVYNNSFPLHPEKGDEAQKYYDKKDIYFYCACATITIGVAGIIYGAISYSKGKRKTKEYQIKLDNLRTGFYYTPNQAGLKLTFKF